LRDCRSAYPRGATGAEFTLELDDAGALHYLPEPLAACRRANGLDVGMTLGNEDLACMLVTEWYLAHRTSGGGPDLNVETILRRLLAPGG
jgi:hypothetical protein